MPLCTVMTQAGVLSAEAKTKLAGGLTSFHSEYAVIDHPDHAARQLVDALGQNLRELLTRKRIPRALQKEATDLVDHSRSPAD
jgi:hypothetical protein